MKVPQLAMVLPATAALLLAGCDRGAQQAESQRLAEERATLEREKAALAADKAAQQQAAIDAERARIEADRAKLDRERENFSRDTQAHADQDAERQRLLAAERRNEDEAAARREAEARERQARENAPESQTTQSVSYFYDSLDPYGDWVEIEPYGYAFRPNVARNVGWRPYTEGDWIYTDYGWTWRSDEPFGWATYHYGRWARVPRLGWIWVPGTEWGPAWVSWRRSSDYIGWAPLPPDAWSSRGFNAGVDSYFNIGPGMYNFVRMVDFGESTYVGRVVEPAQNATIINQTTNVTNVVYKTVENRTTIVNEGPDITVINQRARQPVRRMRVERVESGAPQLAKAQGNTLQMVAPVLKKPAAGAAAKPRQVRERVKAAEVDRGWSGVKADENRVRAEAAKQARDAEQAERSEPKTTPRVPVPVIAPTPSPRGPAPATPPSLPPRTAKPTPSETPMATPPAPTPERPPQPIQGGRPGRPGKPPLPGGEITPFATPKPSEAVPPTSPVVPGKGEKHGKQKGQPVPPQTEPGEVAPPTPPAPVENRPHGRGKGPDASRDESIPWNRPERWEGPKTLPATRPGMTPTPEPQAIPGEPQPGQKKKKDRD